MLLRCKAFASCRFYTEYGILMPGSSAGKSLWFLLTRSAFSFLALAQIMASGRRILCFLRMATLNSATSWSMLIQPCDLQVDVSWMFLLRASGYMLVAVYLIMRYTFNHAHNLTQEIVGVFQKTSIRINSFGYMVSDCQTDRNIKLFGIKKHISKCRQS